LNPPEQTLLQIFAAEQAEHVERMRSVIAGLALSAPDPPAIQELLRRAHTLKGASRAAGVESTETLTHAVEDVLAGLRSERVAFTPSVQTLLFRVLDTIEDILTAVLSGQTVPGIEELLDEIAGALRQPRRIVPAHAQSGPASSEARAAVSSSPGSTRDAESIRINAAYLDELMSASSELVASTAEVESEAETSGTVRRAEEAWRDWSRLRKDVSSYVRRRQSDPEFAPLLECLQGAESHLRALLSEARWEASARRTRDWTRRRLADRLEETALNVRMVSAESVFGGFGPMLRALAHEENKQIDYRAEGLELPADRLILQSFKDPVMHLLRNAVSHGVEPENERLAAGKSASGSIRLSIRSQGDRLLINVKDDGRGLDRQALAEEAVRRGLAPHTGAALSDSRLADLMFLPGFSTSSMLSTLSGRGMGLAIVRHEVDRFHGEIRVRTETAKGTGITLSLPLSVSSQSVLLVSGGGQTFGIVTSFIRRLCRIRRSEIQTFEGQPSIVLDSQPVGLLRLTDMLGFSANQSLGDKQETLPTVIVEAAGQLAAIVVDEMTDVRDVVIKPLALSPADAGFAAGAIALPDGSVGLILKMNDLLDRSLEANVAHADVFRAPEESHRPHTILVVDDSITTRSLEKSLLEAHGYKVHVAVDGVEALAALGVHPVDLVITDIMMPRMDGFQLLEQIRRDPKLAQLPVIVVSSMESRADQERGLALGADAYITKRKFDQRDLLETVRRVL
jgi:two-component system chemotaxis sensor kinase CheA